MKAYRIMLFLLTVNIATIYVNSTGLFSSNITVNANTLPSFVVPSIVFTLAAAALGSVIFKDSITGAVYAAFGAVYWSTYITAIVTVRQMLPAGVLLLFSPVYTIVFIAALLQLKTGGWEYDV